MAYNVTGLTNYVKENQDLLLKKVVLEGDTISMLRKQLGIKTKERIHIFDEDAPIQDGSQCGFSASGSTTISERLIDTKMLKVDKKWCPKDLLGKYAEYLVRIGAGDEELPFEEDIMNGIIEKINKQMEVAVWQSTSAQTTGEGIIAQAEGSDSGSTISGATTSAQNIYDAVIAAYNLIPEEILGKAVIFVSPANFRALNLYLVNNYKYNASLMDGETKDLYIPGTDTKVHKTIGLTGVNNKIVAFDPQNVVYGCDMLDDKEKIKLWFSDDNDEYRLKVEWNAGVKSIMPDEIVIVTKG